MMKVKTEKSVRGYIDYGLSKLYDDTNSEDFREHKQKAYEYGQCISFKAPLNKHPKIQAAGAIYVSSLLKHRKRTQEQVANALDTTEVSVREVNDAITEHCF